ncbi:MAG: signal peptidase I [Planctomycetota bacterium]
MAKKKSIPKQKRTTKVGESKAKVEESGNAMYAFRETIESIVIAFVLAFLFRTFEAEAFVIPTGSMSPSLQGQHKDVCCSECGYRFRATASEEAGDRLQYASAELARTQQELRRVEKMLSGRLSSRDRGRLEYALTGLRQDEQQKMRLVKSFDTVAGMCPMCRQLMPMRPDLPSNVPAAVGLQDVEEQKTYPGDRILVNKYCYTHSDPQRWDVVVFKFPGNGEMNYIKRLVGLPNETLRIYQGDIFVSDEANNGEFEIERKPSDKVDVMLQVVHDTNYDPVVLYDAGWPLRWKVTSSDGWDRQLDTKAKTVGQTYSITASSDETTHWLEYQHFVPQQRDWATARTYQQNGDYGNTTKEQWLAECKPELIRDFNPYNADRSRGGTGNPRAGGIEDIGWTMPEEKFGMHWVGDLAIDCNLTVEEASGEFYLRLVEAGRAFICRVDLSSGDATVSLEGDDSVSATAKTTVRSPGDYQLRFANVDDQLLLWIDGSEVLLSGDSPALIYDADQVYDGRENAVPQSSPTDLGDLAPAAIGARGASVSVDRLQVLRDIYYIATRWDSEDLEKICDFPHPMVDLTPEGKRYPTLSSVRQQFTDPSKWTARFKERRKEDFPIESGQLFVMGDNSPASSDCRLWASGNGNAMAKPGGSYLDRRLLIGKAVCVFWPHSWGEIPFIKRLPGFPNFGDMRLVR